MREKNCSFSAEPPFDYQTAVGIMGYLSARAPPRLVLPEIVVQLPLRDLGDVVAPFLPLRREEML